MVINKMDTTDWSQQRFDELTAILKTFLKKQAGFSNVRFVPASGLNGINLIDQPPADHLLRKWYTGPTLLEIIGTYFCFVSISSNNFFKDSQKHQEGRSFV